MYPQKVPSTYSPTSDSQDSALAAVSPLPWPGNEYSADAAVFFLDTEFFDRSHLNTLASGSPKSVPEFITACLGDQQAVRQTAIRFFDLTHPWFPVVSKRRFLDQLLNPLLPTRQDVSLLCFCMKLCTDTSKNHNGEVRPSQEYHAAAKYFYELHRSGLMSLEILQAGIYLAVYELGHALLPAAHSTIAACVSYGLCLGLNWSALSTDALQRHHDEEESLRVWWAIYLLER